MERPDQSSHGIQEVPPPWLTRDLLSDWDEDWLVLEPCLRHLLATAEELGEAAQAPE
jgi:hypothetical protein